VCVRERERERARARESERERAHTHAREKERGRECTTSATTKMANISARLPSGPRLALASCTCRLRKWARDNQCAHTGARAGASGQRESDAGRERSLCSSRQRSMATSCVQRGAAWTFAAWCLRFSHGVRGSAGMPAEWECEGARGGVSVPSSLACRPTGPARRRRASQSEAVRTHAAPTWMS